jgi:hypothetical protein
MAIPRQSKQYSYCYKVYNVKGDGIAHCDIPWRTTAYVIEAEYLSAGEYRLLVGKKRA